MTPRLVASGLALLIGLLASCGGDEPATPQAASDRSVASTGIDLFNERVVGSNPGCVTCHALDGDIVLVGPSLAGLAARADSTVPGMTGAEYVRQAIVDPDAHIVDGFSAGQMAGGWGDLLTTEQIESLVELLLSD